MRAISTVLGCVILGFLIAAGAAQATLNTPALHFYNSKDGSVAIGSFQANTFNQRPSPGAFSPGWSHIVHMPNNSGQIFVYNHTTGAGAVAEVMSDGQYHTSKSFAAGNFTQGWTNIAGLGGNQLVFYRRSDGLGALALLAGDGKISTVKGYAIPNFGQGGIKTTVNGSNTVWSSIVSTLRGAFFYDRNTGVGQMGAFRNDGTFQVTKDFGAKFSPGWTHIAAMPLGSNTLDQLVVFYNASTGSVALAMISDTTHDVTTTKAYKLDSGYTSVVPTASQIFFYNRNNGNAALADYTQTGEISGIRQMNGQFSPGWTSIVYGF